MNQVLIEKLTNILEVNLDKEHFGVKEFAKEAGISRSKLHRKLKSITGKSASRFIREFRLQKAMVMLQNNVATASEIAYRVGFSSPTYFNTCFHDFYGYPPGEVKFRNANVENLNEEHDLETINSDQSKSRTSSIKKRFLAKKMVWINTLLILFLCVVSYNLYDAYKNHVSEELISTNDDDKSIAILPFKNLSEAKDDEFFTRGVRISLQNQLSTLKDIRIISGNSMDKYLNTQLAPSEIANEIGVDYLMDGSVQKHGDSIRIIIHFINAKDNLQLNSMVFIEEFRNMLNLQGKIAKQVIEELNIKLSQEEVVQIEKIPTENLEAYNLYLKGRFFWQRRTEEGLNKSIHYFNQAIKLDTTFALAYAGLADSYILMPMYRNIIEIDQKGIKQSDKFTDSMYNLTKKYAWKSLSIDKNTAEAHATLGMILCIKDWNWKASEKEFKLALKLNPNYATAHQWYAQLLRTLGRRKEAREQIDLALNLDPNSFIFHHCSGDIYYEDGLFEKAISEYNKAKEINKFQPGPYDLSADCYTYWGKDDVAIAEYEECFKLMEPNLDKEDLELYYKSREDIHNSGMMGVKRFWTNRLIKKGEYPYQVSLGFSFLGEKKKALDWLELAYEQRDPNLFMIRHSAEFNILHNEPRYLAILEKMNLGDYD